MIVLEVTASQLENYWPDESESCRRRWWFRAVRHLPTISRYGSAFGDVLHKVLERWLTTDDRGVDLRTGKAVEVFPPGWLDGFDRFGNYTGTVTPYDGEVIRKLLEAAIESGALTRPNGRQVEVAYQLLIDVGDGREVRLHGHKDLQCGTVKDPEVWDFKSHKSMKYAKSENRIKRSPQMLSYALDCYETALAAGHKLPHVRVKHVIFCKDPDDLRVTERPAVISEEDILAFKAQLINVCRDMLEQKKRTEESDWKEVPGPPKGSRACLAFGGCQFTDICADGRSEEQYRVRIQNQKEKAKKSLENGALTNAKPRLLFGVQVDPAVMEQNRGGSFVGFAEKIKARAAVKEALAKPAEAPAQASPKPAPAAAPKPPAEAKVTQIAKDMKAADPTPHALDGGPPWADPGCRACKGTGIASTGRPCRVCDATAGKRGVKDSSNFVIVPDGNGGIVWEPLAGGDEDVGGAELPEQPGEVQVDQETEAPEQDPEGEEVTSEEELPTAEPVEEAQSEEESKADQIQAEQQARAEAARADAPKPPNGKRPPGRPPGAKNKPKAPPTVVTPSTAMAQQIDSEAPLTLELQAPEGGVPAPKHADTGKGMILVVNCSVYTGMQVTPLTYLFDLVARQIAQAHGVPTFYHVNAFRRRDAMGATAARLASMFEGHVVAGTMDSPDLVAFVAALRPFTSSYFEGHGR